MISFLTIIFSIVTVFGVVFSDIQMGVSVVADIIFNVVVLIPVFFICKWINHNYSEKLKVIMFIDSLICLSLTLLILITKNYDLAASLVPQIGIFAGFFLSTIKK